MIQASIGLGVEEETFLNIIDIAYPDSNIVVAVTNTD